MIGMSYATLVSQLLGNLMLNYLISQAHCSSHESLQMDQTQEMLDQCMVTLDMLKYFSLADGHMLPTLYLHGHEIIQKLYAGSKGMNMVSNCGKCSGVDDCIFQQ